MKPNILLFLTASYPYGYGETFIEGEIPYLAEYFDKIIIITNDTTTILVRPIPKNVEVLRFPYLPTKKEKLFSIKYIFSPILLKELNTVRNIYKIPLTKSIIAAALGSIYKGHQLKKLVLHTITRNNYNQANLYIYSYWTNDMATGVAFIKQNLKEKIKAFSRAHGWDVYHERSEINYLPLRNFIFKNLDKVFFISKQGLDYTLKKMGETYKTFNVSRLGTYSNKQLNPHQKESVFHIVSCSSINKIKRLDLLITALSLISKDHCIKWSHIGEGPLSTEIKNLATKLLQTKTNIEFIFVGQLMNKKILEFYDRISIDLFINISSSEGIPVSIMEAMSKGIPAIATQVGGTEELVNNNNGYLISSDITPKELSIIITKIINNPEELKYKRVGAFYTWNKEYNGAKNYTNFIHNIDKL